MKITYRFCKEYKTKEEFKNGKCFWCEFILFAEIKAKEKIKI